MLKTMTRKDYLFLKHLLPRYYAHLLDNPNTLIVRFFGFHKILYKKGREFIKQYFVVMGNVFKSPLEVHMSYDLKGSTHGRSTDDNEDFAVPRKDLDFNQSGLKISLSDEIKKELLGQLERDCEFLSGNQINDYSFLLGIHTLKEEVFMPAEESHHLFERSFGGILSNDNRCIYFIGIIDILTVFNFTKKLEHLVKSQLYGNTVSCIPPDHYSQRFLQYMRSIIT
jgi:1-phosphatidylinositol-4-phosphate 5-kinase